MKASAAESASADGSNGTTGAALGLFVSTGMNLETVSTCGAAGGREAGETFEVADGPMVDVALARLLRGPEEETAAAVGCEVV